MQPRYVMNYWQFGTCEYLVIKGCVISLHNVYNKPTDIINRNELSHQKAYAEAAAALLPYIQVR